MQAACPVLAGLPEMPCPRRPARKASRLPGRPGWSPTQTPHRSVLARLTHTAPHFRPSRPAIRLLFRGHVHGFRCTRHVSLQRSLETASPSLRGVLRSSSPASSVLWDAPTPCRPSRRTSLPSLGDTTVASLIRSHRPGRGPWAPGSWYSGSRAGNVGGNGRVSQVPERPSCPCALFSDPGRTECTPGHCGVSARPPLKSTTVAPAERRFRGSIARH